MTSKAGYWIGGGLIAAAILGAILWAVLSARSFIDTLDEFQHVPVPGRGVVELQARKYVVYVEGPNADQSTPPVSIAVTDARTEQPVTIDDYGGSLTYSFDTDGSAVATVTPPRAGSYEVRTTGPAEGGGYQLALGESVAGRIVRGILGVFAIGGVGLAAGIGLLVVTGVRRSRARSRTQEQNLPGFEPQ